MRRSGKRAATRYRVCRTADLAAGQSMKFMLPVRGAEEDCFAINFNGDYHAYVNRCRHVPMAMDWIDNQFFAEQGRYLMCQTHNAYFEPASGECIAGPASACGKFLYRVPLEIDDGVIYARPPEQEFDD
jgi:nitrite reductase/ring-hydroxylating ferredoxin subunit